MKKMKKKLLPLFLTAAICQSLAVVPADAETEDMVISAPEYFCMVDENTFYEVEAPVDGSFMDVSGWSNTDNDAVYSAIPGTFKTSVNVSGGAGKTAALIGAVYDENNKLISVAVDQKETAAEKDELSVTNEVAEGQKFKQFIWNDKIAPIAAAQKAPRISYFYCDDPNTVTVAWFNEGGNYTLYKNGEAVDSSALSEIGKWNVSWNLNNISKYPVYVYTDTAAAEGDKYIVKNGDVSAEELTAHFESGAYIEMGKYISGRNMMYLRNNDYKWDTDIVSKHVNLYGKECDSAVTRTVGGRTKTTIFYFKLDPDFISGSGNAVDVTFDYFDAGTGSVNIQYFADGTSNTAVTTKNAVNKTNSMEWKTATVRLYNTEFNANTILQEKSQLRIYGAAIAKISVAPYFDSTIDSVYSEAYVDGIRLRWNVPVNSNGVTGYTVKRNGEVVAEHLTIKIFDDTDIETGTEYSYTVTAEYGDTMGNESAVYVYTAKTKDPLSIVLPTDQNEGAFNKEYGSGGLTFAYNNSNARDDSMNVVVERGGKLARTTVVEDRGTNPATWGYYLSSKEYSSNSNIRYTRIRYKVDNSVISQNERNVAIEFDYFDDSNVTGKKVILEYLGYNNGNASKVNKKEVAEIEGTNQWKTAKVVITDAQFDHNSSKFAGYDFRIGLVDQDGGFATTYAKVYVPLTKSVAYAQVNADGTTLDEQNMVLKHTEEEGTSAYDRNILLSGKTDMPSVDGKHYMYNTEYDVDNWRRWKNGFYFNVDDGFLSGTDYSTVSIAVDYYAPSGNITVVYRQNPSDKTDTTAAQAVQPNKWSTAVFNLNNITFSNTLNGDDFRINFDCQGYINRVTLYKNYSEDAAQNKVTKDVYLMGDSICAGHPGAVGWGNVIGDLFSDRVNVYNKATAGASTKTYAHYDEVKNAVVSGDYVFIQFGHNDSMTGTDRGVDTATYKTNLTTWITELKAKGAIPVLLSSAAINRDTVDGKLVSDAVEPYRAAMKEVADANGVIFIDVYAENKTLFNNYWTADNGSGFYISDGVHLTQAGAEEMAKIIARGIKNTSALDVLAKYIPADINLDPTIPQ